MESRRQGSRPRPRTQNNFKAKDRPFRAKAKDTDASVLQKKRSSKFFSGDLKKKVFKNFFQAKKVFKIFFSSDLYFRKLKKRSLQIFRKVSGVFQRNFNGLKIVLSSSRGQGNFRGLEASRPRPRTSKCVLEDSTSANGKWFYDAYTTSGVLFNGMMPHACKNPLERQTFTGEIKFKTELIRPVKKNAS